MSATDDEEDRALWPKLDGLGDLGENDPPTVLRIPTVMHVRRPRQFASRLATHSSELDCADSVSIFATPPYLRVVNNPWNRAERRIWDSQLYVTTI
jgi:hypothetical protein